MLHLLLWCFGGAQDADNVPHSLKQLYSWGTLSLDSISAQRHFYSESWELESETPTNVENV